MSADLTRARTERGEVVRVERLGSLIELTVTLPWLAATAAPGQFAQLRCGDGIEPLLRRPFSVAWTENDRCGFMPSRTLSKLSGFTSTNFRSRSRASGSEG